MFFGKWSDDLLFKTDPMIIVPKMLELLHSGFELFYQSIVAVPDVTHGSHVVGGPLREVLVHHFPIIDPII